MSLNESTLQIDQEPARRLPIYLLLDVSGSMSGAPIEAVNEGLRAFARALLDDPHASETAHISMITFGGSVEQRCSMVPAPAFRPDVLSASGLTPLGEALLLLDSAISAEVRLRTTTEQADWKPLVFLFTDGKPTDEGKWQQALQKLRDRTDRRVVTFVSVGAGPEADCDMLHAIGGPVLRMAEVTPASIAAFFQWVSASTKVASRSASAGIPGELELPPLPQVLRIEAGPAMP
jgi:uncharacterized protein YegL